MKKLNKLISLLLVILIVLTASACGKDTADGTTAPSTAKNVDTDVTQANNTTASDEAPATTAPAGTTTPETTEAVNNTPETQAHTKAPETTEPVTEAPVPATGVLSATYESNGDVQKQIVYYPAALKNTGKKYPIVAWANGTMCTPDLYTDLLKQIAEGGYIVIASYETMAADGTAQIDSIDLMIKESSNSSSVFYNKVDTGKIAVIGHSQGGRSSVNSAAADSRIDCLVSIAGSNYDYEAEKNSKPSLFLAGSKDMIVDKDQWIVPAYDLAKGPAVYACLDGAIHTTCCSDASKYSSYIISWLDAWLKNDSAAKSMFKNGGTLSKDSAWIDFACKGM